MQKKRSLTGKNFVLLTGLVSVCLLALLAAIGTHGLFYERIFGYQHLYAYQQDKIAIAQDVDLLFVGDSSLGNAIDAEYFNQLTGKRSINLALTGRYGYAGTYNMIKKAMRPSVKTVVVMHTPDILQRPVAYDGYLFTLNSAGDIHELSRRAQYKLTRAYIDLVLSPKNLEIIGLNYLGSSPGRTTIENDYIRQNGKIDTERVYKLYTIKFNRAKLDFLYQIKTYCDARNIRLVYVHGPLLESAHTHSTDYIGQANAFLRSTGISLIEEVIPIAAGHIGDATDHVAPAHKQGYTHKFAELLKL